MSALTPDDVRPRLNKTSTIDDDELQDMIDAAEAEFAELIGPLEVTSYTEEYAGPVVLLKFPVVAVASVTSYYGTLLASADYTLTASSGVLTLPCHGGPYAVVYTAGHAVLPANYREVIIADVAGYFAATQRGGGTIRPAFPGEAADIEPGTTFPLSPWPRIAALAKRLNPAIA